MHEIKCICVTQELTMSRYLNYIIHISKISSIHVCQNSVGFLSSVYLGLFLYVGTYGVEPPKGQDKMNALYVDAQTSPDLKH